MEYEARNKGGAATLGRWTALSVKWSCDHAKALVAFVFLLTLALGWFSVTHLSIDTRTDRLLDPNLPWRVEEKALNDAFPQNNHVLAIVIDAATPEIADAAAGKLVPALSKRPETFRSINDPADNEFLRRNGLLFLNPQELRAVTAQLIGAQGLLGTLVIDPSLNGLFRALNLALEGVERGEIAPKAIETPLSALAETLAAEKAGHPSFLSWRKMLTGREPLPIESLRVITVRPALDYSEITPGIHASREIRTLARALGLTSENGVRLRLTGDVALDDEEFASIEAGMGLATVLSVVLVLALLYIGVHALRAIGAILATLIVGLVWTLGFAAIAIGTLNLVSVAFVVMFIGMAVDFGIQFCVRYRDEFPRLPEPAHAARRSGRTLGGALLLAAMTAAVGFLAFLPTGYRGVAELGIVAGAGMLIALLLNITLLPALLVLVNWRPRPRRNELFLSDRPDRFVARHRKKIIATASIVLLGSCVLLPRLTFDFDPIDLKNPNSESVKALRDLERAGAPSTNVMEVLTRSRADLPALIKRLESLPEVADVTSLLTFVPDDQEEKMGIIDDAAALILPAYDLAGTTPQASDRATIATIQDTVKRLRAMSGRQPVFARLADLLDAFVNRPKPDLASLNHVLLAGLDGTLANLALMMEPTGIREDRIPADFKADWLSPDGQYRVEVTPKAGHGEPARLSRFIAAVRGVAAQATGPAYFIQKAGHVVWKAFRHAFFFAVLGVTVILSVVLARALDVALVIGPLLFSALVTLALTVLLHLPINFANVIAFPILIGIGVAFNIYFVSNWRAGQDTPLRSSTARAVILSALTTLTAFGSLALSPHAGTASMGVLLTLCLGVTLMTALVLLPALLALLRAPS